MTRCAKKTPYGGPSVPKIGSHGPCTPQKPRISKYPRSKMSSNPRPLPLGPGLSSPGSFQSRMLGFHSGVSAYRNHAILTDDLLPDNPWADRRRVRLKIPRTCQTRRLARNRSAVTASQRGIPVLISRSGFCRHPGSELAKGTHGPRQISTNLTAARRCICIRASSFRAL